MKRSTPVSGLSIALLGLALLAGSACKKSSSSPVEEHTDVVTPIPGLLTRVTIGNPDGLNWQFSYNKNMQPLVIKHFADKFMIEKDSIIYDANGKLEKVYIFSAPLHRPDLAPELFRVAKFEWDAKGNISRKATCEPGTGAVRQDRQYTYDASGNLIKLTTSINESGLDLKLVSTYAWELNNINKETITDGTNAISNMEVTHFDLHANYITNPLLRYLLEDDGPSVFSHQNLRDTRKVEYVTFNGKKDSIVTVTKNTYEYNNTDHPVKLASFSTVKKPEYQQEVFTKRDVTYEYSK